MNKFAVILLVSASARAQLAPLPEVGHSKIEYQSPAEALAALRTKPGVEISVQRNWTIAFEPARYVIWSFAPQEHSAYPTVVKRTVVEKDGAVFVNMDVKCQASKSACDALVREFLQLNEDMRTALQSKRSKAK